MKKILFLAVAALMLTACNRNSTYTIEGSFDIPESFELGDTVLTRGPITGYVYLCTLDGMPFDSAQVTSDEKFTFTGPVDPKQPYFVYIISEYAAGMLAIEPGKMSAVLGEPLLVTGTPTNDAICELMSKVDEIGLQLADEIEAIQVSKTDTLTAADIAPVYLKYSAMVDTMVDSVYNENSENLVGVYCANVKTVQSTSSAELESLIAPMSDYVKNSELIQKHLQYLHEAEERYSYGEDNLGN